MFSRNLMLSVIAGLVFVAAGAALLKATDIRPDSDAIVSLGSTVVSPREGERDLPVLRIAVSGMTSPRDTFESYRGFSRYLADEVGMDSELIVRKTYGEINELIASGDIDVAFVCSGAYVLDEPRKTMELLVAPVVRGKSFYHSEIIVPKASVATSILDLKGRRFAYVDELSNTGYLAPRRYLSSLSVVPDDFFSETVFTLSHDKSVRAVGNGVVDGAAIDNLVLEGMLLAGDKAALQTRVIQRLGPYGMPPVVVRPDMNETLKNRLRMVFLASDKDPDALSHLVKLGIDRFRVPDHEEYLTIDVTSANASPPAGE